MDRSFLRALLSEHNVTQNNNDEPEVFQAIRRWNQPKLIRLLSTRDVNVNSSYTCHSPLSLAASNGQVDLVRILLSHPNLLVNAVLPNGSTALMEAVKHGANKCVDALLSHPQIDVALTTSFSNAFRCAIATQNARLLSLLIVRAGTWHVNTKVNGVSDWTFALQSKIAPAILEMLVCNGADLQTPLDDQTGETVIQRVCSNYDVPTLRYLIRKGVNINGLYEFLVRYLSGETRPETIDVPDKSVMHALFETLFCAGIHPKPIHMLEHEHTDLLWFIDECWKSFQTRMNVRKRRRE